jgi:hypothetical protein
MKEGKKKADPIEVVIKQLFIHYKGFNCNPETTSPHIIKWDSSRLPYEELQDALYLISESQYIVSDFNFYCKAHKGDSVGWQLTLHIKHLEPTP